VLIAHNNDKQQVTQERIKKVNPQNDTTLVFNYVYNEHGDPDSLVLIRNIKDENVYESLTIYFYDKANGNVIRQTQKKWNTFTAKWESEIKTEFTYDANNRLRSEEYYHYNTLFWTANTKYEYVYDENGLLAEKILYKPIYRQWRKIYTIEYSQIKNGRPNLMESKYNFWGGETGQYVENYIPYYFNDEIAIMNADRMELLYNIETSILSNTDNESGSLKIYPNPSDGVFYISLQNSDIRSWEVFNLRGELVKENINIHRTGVVDLTNLPDGLYMIKATSLDNKVLKQKIVINKTK
jgi:hypothetical protein